MSAFVSPTSIAPRALRRTTFVTNRVGHRVACSISRRVRAAPATTMMAEASAEPASPPASEKFEFQAEVNRVMNLIINSLYSNKEVFLRELVSNASDACDKKRFLSLSAGSSEGSNLGIYVKADKDKGIITVEDEGIGMTRQELISNLGSIATSGTSKFLEALGEGSSTDVSLIGQFGVGFYSAYLVADRVEVVTRSYTDPKAKQYRWESSADNSFTVSEDNSEPFKSGSGTRIILHVKNDSKEFLENFKLVELMKKYSEFVQFPVYGWDSRTEFDEVPDGDEKEADGKPKTKRVPRTVEEWSQVNKLKPLWMRKPKEVEEKEYEEFYKTISKDFSPPFAHTHFAVEGDVEFRALLYCPKALPPELRQNMFVDDAKVIRLYVKRVFISDNFEDIVPRWLSFLKGVVDSEDLPLNVSREILQKSKVLRTISKRLIRKAIDMFRSIKTRDNDDYGEFWRQFGRYVKAGIIESKDYTEDLIKLAMWASTNSSDKFTDLDGYVSRMKEDQKDIYFVAAESRERGESAPAMERLRKLGFEVLFLVEPIDEIAIQNVSVFKTKRRKEDSAVSEFKFVDVAKDSLDLAGLKSEKEKQEDEALAADFKPVVDFLTKLLSNKVGKVQLSDRLTESPSTITQSSFGFSPTMERYMRDVGASNMNDPGMSSFMAKSRTLEINAKHPIVKDIKVQLEGAAGGDDEQIRQTGMLVYELAMLTGGYPLENTAEFARRVSSLVSPNVEAPKVVVPEPEAPAPSLADEPEGVRASEMKKDLDEKLKQMGTDFNVNVIDEENDEKEQGQKSGKVDGGDDEGEIKSVKSEIVE